MFNVVGVGAVAGVVVVVFVPEVVVAVFAGGWLFTIPLDDAVPDVPFAVPLRELAGAAELVDGAP